LAVLAVVWNQRNSRGAHSATRGDSMPPIDTVTSRPIQPTVRPAAAAPAQDSLPVRDSTSAPPATSAKTPPPVPMPAVKATPTRSKASADSARVPNVRPESLPAVCARLLERFGLGEKLTEGEQKLLKGQCRK